MWRTAVLFLLLPLAACGGGASEADGHYCQGSATDGCVAVPRDATKEEFCSAGEAFSTSSGFANGLRAAKALAAVGTPDDIDEGARAGFVELVERMVDSRDADDFRQRTSNLSQEEKDHLLDLDNYIQSACALS